MEVTGARGTPPMGHGSKNRRHRELAGVKGNSPRLIRRPEERAEAADAMAGGRSSQTHANRAQTAMKYKIESTGGRRGARRSSPRGKTDSKTAAHAEGRTADPGDLRLGSCGFLVHWRAQYWSGEATGRAATRSAPFCRGRGAGGAHTIEDVGPAAVAH